MWNDKKVGSQEGFTLLDMLVSLSIFMIMTTTFPLLFSIFQKYVIVERELHPFEWEVAIRQLTMEVREAKVVMVNENSLMLHTIDDRVVTYNQYMNSVRRQVNGTGHEIVLQHIGKVKFYDMNNSIYLEVEDLASDRYKARIFRWIDVINSA